MPHTLMMAEQSYSTGTWGGALLTGFTLRCGSCKAFCVVENKVVKLGASIYGARSARQLTCPYCSVKDDVELDNGGRILEDHSIGAEY